MEEQTPLHNIMIVFVKIRANMNTHEVTTFHICYISSKVILKKPHIKTKKTTSTWLSYILKELHSFLEVLLL